MPSIIQADQLKSSDGVTTYLNSGTLSNLTFPANTIINQKFHTTTSQPTITSNNNFASFSTPFKTTITGTKSNSKFLIIVSMTVSSSSTGDAHIYGRLRDNTNSNATIGTEGSDGLFGDWLASNAYSGGVRLNHTELYTPSSHSGGDLEIEVLMKQNGAVTTLLNRRSNDNFYQRFSSTLTILEIAG